MLTILQHDDGPVPEGDRKLPRGVIVNLEVEDLEAVHARLVEVDQVPVVRSLREEDFGQRRVFVSVPESRRRPSRRHPVSRSR